MMMMMLRRNTRDKLGCYFPLKNLVAPFHSIEAGGGDWNEYARMVYDKMLESRPLPPRERFNKLLGRLLKFDLHPAVISLNRQMVLHGIPRDEYNLSTLLLSYSHLHQFGFGLSVMVNYIKMGFQFDATHFDSLVRSFVERKILLEILPQLVPEGHCERSYVAIFYLMGGLDEDFKDYTSINEFFLKSRNQYCWHNNLQARVTYSTPRPENTDPDAEPKFLQGQYDMHEHLGLGRDIDNHKANKARVTNSTPRPENTDPDAEPKFLQGQYDMCDSLGLWRLWRNMDNHIANKARVTKGTPWPENTDPDAEPHFLQGQYDMGVI